MINIIRDAFGKLICETYDYRVGCITQTHIHVHTLYTQAHVEWKRLLMSLWHSAFVSGLFYREINDIVERKEQQNIKRLQ